MAAVSVERPQLASDVIPRRELQLPRPKLNINSKFRLLTEIKTPLALAKKKVVIMPLLTLILLSCWTYGPLQCLQIQQKRPTAQPQIVALNCSALMLAFRVCVCWNRKGEVLVMAAQCTDTYQPTVVCQRQGEANTSRLLHWRWFYLLKLPLAYC